MSDTGETGGDGDDHTRMAPRPVADSVAPTAAHATVGEPRVDGATQSALATGVTAKRNLIGAELNGIYRIDSFLSSGGMGEVYLASNVVRPRERVAVKVMLPHLAHDPGVRERFEQEADALLKLSHEALVQYRLAAYDPGLDLLYSVTEFIDGPSLRDVIDRGPVSDIDLHAFLRRMAGGLAHAHARGIVHRDLKPANILLPGGLLHAAKVIDFGIARHMDSGHSTTMFGFMGTLSYAAPEQFGMFGGGIGPASDVYALGLLALALATGRDPPMGRTPAEAIDCRSRIPELTGAPAALQPLLVAMLQPDKADRIKDMTVLLARLDEVELGGTVAQQPRPAPAASQPPSEPRRIVLRAGWRRYAVVAPMGVVAIVGLALILRSITGPRPVTPPQLEPPAALRAGTYLDYAGLVDSVDLDCTWLYVEAGSSASRELKVAGASSHTEANIRAAVASAVSKAGLAQPTMTVRTYTATDNICDHLDMLRTIRTPSQSSHEKLSWALQSSGKWSLQMSLLSDDNDFVLLTYDDGSMERVAWNRGREVRSASKTDPTRELKGESITGSLATIPVGPADPCNCILLQGPKHAADNPTEIKNMDNLIASVLLAPTWKATLVNLDLPGSPR